MIIPKIVIKSNRLKTSDTSKMAQISFVIFFQ